jgi:2-keto-3-deoxy-L-rhamnonate aldolase RhmA
MDKIASTAAKHGVTPGMLAVDDVRKRAEQGYRLLNMTGDIWLLKEAAENLLRNSRKVT